MNHVKEFLSTHAKPDSTEICTETADPVVQEVVKPHVVEQTATAIDRERHIHHHQARVQPITHSETLPVEHEYNVVPAITKENLTEMGAEQKARLIALQTQHKPSRTVAETQRTAEHVGTSVNEHVHHHVHEHITPLIQKETIAPKTVHTVIPIHEKIHDAPIVHEATVLPAMSMDEFKAKLSKTTTVHGGKDHSHTFYEGQPKVASH